MGEEAGGDGGLFFSIFFECNNVMARPICMWLCEYVAGGAYLCVHMSITL